jgi:hypothetical protein
VRPALASRRTAGPLREATPPCLNWQVPTPEGGVDPVFSHSTAALANCPTYCPQNPCETLCETSDGKLSESMYTSCAGDYRRAADRMRPRQRL